MPHRNDPATWRENMREENSRAIVGVSEQQITPSKAKEILKDGEIGGKPLEEKQEKFFGAVAGGETPEDA